MLSDTQIKRKASAKVKNFVNNSPNKNMQYYYKMKPSEKLKKGTKVAYKNGQGLWVESVIEKCTTSSVWFKGMGYSSLRKTTFDNYPELYKVIDE